MNQYRCRSCEYATEQLGIKYCLKVNRALDVASFNYVGCASHSDFNPQAERERVLDEVLLRINNLLNGLYDEKRKSFWFRLSQAKSNSTAEFTLRFVVGIVEELRQKDGE